LITEAFADKRLNSHCKVLSLFGIFKNFMCEGFSPVDSMLYWVCENRDTAQMEGGSDVNCGEDDVAGHSDGTNVIVFEL